MRFFVALTDYDWFTFLASRRELDEVNFWQPSGGREFRAIEPGELLLFKLHSPRNFIVGGGVFAHWSVLPVSLAWEAFEQKNGAGSLVEVRDRLARYRRLQDDHRTDYRIGCILLEQPFFLPEDEWIPAPADWKPNIVQGKGYDASVGEGRRLWECLFATSAAHRAAGVQERPTEPSIVAERFGSPRVILPRLGQGTFRVLVTDLYDRRCAVTGERTLPVLEAAHIKPYALSGPHDPRNGLLLRSDIHTLFDRGYVTVTPTMNFEVSKRIREDYENGRDYYALHGRQLRPPTRADLVPSPEYLDWHASTVFLR